MLSDFKTVKIWRSKSWKWIFSPRVVHPVSLGPVSKWIKGWMIKKNHHQTPKCSFLTVDLKCKFQMKAKLKMNELYFLCTTECFTSSSIFLIMVLYLTWLNCNLLNKERLIVVLHTNAIICPLEMVNNNLISFLEMCVWRLYKNVY